MWLKLLNRTLRRTSCLALVLTTSYAMAATGRYVAQRAFHATNAPSMAPTINELKSGEPVLFTLPVVTSPTLFHGDYSYVINVPQGATRLEVRLASINSDVDLYVRQGLDVALENGQVKADAKSESEGITDEVVVLSGAMLKPGPYYIAVSVFTPNVPSACVLAATYTGAFPTNMITGAHFAAGDEWYTSLFLTNTSSSTQTFTVRFFDGNGAPVQVPLEQGLRYTANGSLSPGGSQIIETVHAPTLTQGWVAVIPDNADSNGIVGFAAFRSHLAGRNDFEAGVPLGSFYGRRSVVLFDNANGFQTGVAFTNPSEFAAANLQVTFRDENGNAGGTYTINLAPKAHTAMVVSQAFPATAGKRGSLLVESSGERFDALGLRFSPAGPFTSFPPQIIE